MGLSVIAASKDQGRAVNHAKHLIIAGLIAAVVLLTTWKLLAYFGNVAHDQKILAEQQVNADMERAKVLAAATKADTALLQQKIDGLTASNNALQRDLAGLRQQLEAQRSKDAQMPPSELATRWNMLLGVGSIKSSPDGLTADLPAAHATVDQLEQLPEKAAEIKHLTDNSLKKDDTLTQALKTLGSTQDELTTCKTKTVPDMKKECDKEKGDIKTQARKGKFKAALGGALAVIGILLGVRHGL